MREAFPALSLIHISMCIRDRFDAHGEVVSYTHLDVYKRQTRARPG
nr:hypothetical protein [Pseudomonas sp. HS-2]